MTKRLDPDVKAWNGNGKNSFSGLRKVRMDNQALAGYIDQVTHANHVKVLTKEEVEALYPGAKVDLRPETQAEASARLLKNARMRGAALRKDKAYVDFE